MPENKGKLRGNTRNFHFMYCRVSKYIKDIKERNSIEKIQELNDLINVLASAL